MKKIFMISIMVFISVAVLTSCDNGNVKKDVIDSVESAKHSYDSLITLYYKTGYVFGQKDAQRIINHSHSKKKFNDEYNQLTEKSKSDANNLVIKTFAPLFKKYEFEEIRETIIEIFGKTDVPEDEYVFIFIMKKGLGEDFVKEWSNGYCNALDETKSSI